MNTESCPKAMEFRPWISSVKWRLTRLRWRRPAPPTPASEWATLSRVRDFVFITGIYAYFVGWLYAYFYYDAFGVQLYSLEFPFYYLIIFSYQALYNIPGAAALTVTLGSFWLAGRMRRHRTVLFVIATLLFPVLFWIALHQAQDDAKNDQFDSTDRTRIVLTFYLDKRVSYPQELLDLNDQRYLRLLTENKDRVIVFYQPESPKELGAGNKMRLPLLVFEIAKRDLASISYEVD